MSQLSQWNPFRSLSRVDTPPSFDDFFRGFGMRPAWRDLEALPEIRIDVNEDDKAYKVKADIPGMKKEDIQVSVEGREVEISAESRREVEKQDESCLYSERSEGRVYRSFSLPGEVDTRNVEAKYEHGVLKLTLPKKPNGKSNRIAVT